MNKFMEPEEEFIDVHEDTINFQCKKLTSRKLSDEIKEKIINFVITKKYTMTRAAEVLEIPYSTVSQICRNYRNKKDNIV